jgi:formylglycine-generating enzyme required for sulfatase activity
MSAPVIRLATPDETAEIRAALCNRDTPTPADLCEHAIYIRENYTTDCPGYAGPVAIVHWGGAPNLLSTLTRKPGGLWRLPVEEQVEAARRDPATAEAAAEAGESLEEYLCGTYYGHDFPSVGERERCLCSRCGKDGDA